MKPIVLAVAAALLLTACSSTGPVRVTSPDVVPGERIRVPYARILVRDVSLPTHAAAEEITLADATGQLTGIGETLWADDPVRAVTLGLATALSDVTRVRVAPEPWPFADYPDVAVDVRVEYLLPQSDGVYVARGLIFVAPEEGRGRDRSATFELSMPFDPEGGFPAIASARSALVGALALEVARAAR